MAAAMFNTVSGAVAAGANWAQSAPASQNASKPSGPKALWARRRRVRGASANIFEMSPSCDATQLCQPDQWRRTHGVQPGNLRHVAAGGPPGDWHSSAQIRRRLKQAT